MKPAFSVILLTTLIGVGQGLFVALYCAEVFVWVYPVGTMFYVYGSIASLALLLAGLFASFFHLGRPERAWRAAAMWRTSWLSREVIALPLTMLAVFAYGLSHYLSIAMQQQSSLSLIVGAIGMFAVLLLFVCTAMIYACMKFLQQWATPLTMINFILLGLVSGFLLAVVHTMFYAPFATSAIVNVTLVLLVLALIFKLAALWRNKTIVPKSTIQTALGIRHNKISQQSTGFMGGSFNTKEFFHGRGADAVVFAARVAIIMALLVPGALIGISILYPSLWIVAAAFIIHYIGLLFERWHFFAQAQHPQNLYYQVDTVQS